MTFAIFHDFPGLENGLPKFHDFSRLSMTRGHPAHNLLDFLVSTGHLYLPPPQRHCLLDSACQ